MKKNKPNHYTDIVKVLLELKTLYPSYNMGRHLSTIIDEYGDVWGLSDKELLFAITKHKATMELDVPHETCEEDINQILQDGLNLNTSYVIDDDINEIY